MALMEIGQLAAISGVTRRTIRYYVAIGLLPPGEGTGPRRLYADFHINRLKLIRKLKDQFLPLDEIKRRMSGMSNVDVALQFRDFPVLGYPEPSRDSVSMAACEEREAPNAGLESVCFSPSPRKKAQPVTHWRRVPVLPDVELFVRENPSPEAKNLLMQLEEITGLSFQSGYRDPEANRRDNDV
jgi:DNA-binding transcriptional MerR regulator